VSGPIPRTLPEAFEAQVARTPGAVAIRTPRDEVTYSELNARANRIARAVVERASAVESPAAILLTPGIAAIAGVYAGLKAALPVLSLDPASPPDRHAAILRDSGAGVLVVDRATRDAGAAAADGTAVPIVDASDLPAGGAGERFAEVRVVVLRGEELREGLHGN